MKKFSLTVAVVLLAGAAFAQDLRMPGGEGSQGPGMMRPGRGPAIEWKIGTVVTTEYKKLTGEITLGTNGPATLKADGVDYQLMIPRRDLSTLKAGDTITVEGPVSTVKSDKPVQPFVEAFKITVGGKEIDLRRGRGNDGFGGDDDGPGRR